MMRMIGRGTLKGRVCVAGGIGEFEEGGTGGRGLRHIVLGAAGAGITGAVKRQGARHHEHTMVGEFRPFADRDYRGSLVCYCGSSW